MQTAAAQARIPSKTERAPRFSWEGNHVPQTLMMKILGIDPGTREMGAAIIEGRRLLAFGVYTLRNGGRPRDLIDQARRIILTYIERYGPDVVGIEEPLLRPTKRAALVSVIAQELHARSHELGLRVVEISPQDVRRIVVGNPNARKLDVAQAILREGFDDLHDLLPKKPPHPIFGYNAKDRYWLHMFDALAVALAIARSADNAGRTQGKPTASQGSRSEKCYLRRV